MSCPCGQAGHWGLVSAACGRSSHPRLQRTFVLSVVWVLCARIEGEETKGKKGTARVNKRAEKDQPPTPHPPTQNKNCSVDFYQRSDYVANFQQQSLGGQNSVGFDRVATCFHLSLSEGKQDQYASGVAL